jgi:uncharacterized protein with HEPN domain
MADDTRRLAVTHLMMLIGENASRLSIELKEEHDELPWRAIVNLRNRIVHASFDLNYALLFETASEDVLPLQQAVEKMLTDRGEAFDQYD